MDVWEEGINALRKWSYTDGDFQELWKKMVKKLDIHNLELAAMILKHIWFRRNKVIHEKQFTCPQQIFQNALTQIEEFQNANLADYQVDASQDVRTSVELRKWSIPEAPRLKAN